MLSENIKRIRKEKGLSQEELAGKVYVVRQTISKWEQGLSVPDSEMLIAISKALETPVSSLLGENMIKAEVDDLDILAKKLEVINFMLSEEKEKKRKRIHGLFIILALMIPVIFLVLLFLNSPYLNWDYGNPESAVLGVAFQSFEWAFIRIAPIALVLAILGIIRTRK
ncbi:MAG: helix-turn-helix transcriptional regulator [Firmicutes bacterium]|nr:helix-turn-helix transcriptional regulator [Bacillota bacterium]